MHTQMYILEGASRWNMSRAKEAVFVEGASTLRTFDVCFMSHLNNMSQRVLGWALMPEFNPPGEHTGNIYLRAMLSIGVYLSLLCLCVCVSSPH